MSCLKLCDVYIVLIIIIYNICIMPYQFGVNLLLGAVYLPHEASDYYHEDIFEHFTDDIVTIKS